MSTVENDVTFKSRYEKYTLRGFLLTAPVAQVVCMCEDKHGKVGKPLTKVDNIRLDSEKGVVLCINCGKPLITFVQECWGCEKYMWGALNEGKYGCRDCEEFM